MHKISAVIVAYNEEKKIGRCLETLTWADETVVIDAGSTDNTVAICEEFGAKVYHNPWPGYVAQKNFALTKASHDWVISLDADEYLSSELINEITELRTQDFGKFDGYELSRWTFFLGKLIRHCGWGPEYLLRIFKKSKAHWGIDDPHDFVILEGHRARLTEPLFHDSIDNIQHQVEKLTKYAGIIAHNKKKKGIKFSLFQLFLNPLYQFFRMYVQEQGFRDGMRGLIFCINYSYYFFLRNAMLYELENFDENQLNDFK